MSDDEIEKNELKTPEAVLGRKTVSESIIYDKKNDNQCAFLEAKTGENQDSPSDMQLRALDPSDPQYTRLLANRFELVDESSEKKHAKEKPSPKEGQTISLSEFLKNYKTPFIDAYHRSKQLNDGQQGKSKTLEQIFERLLSCPWTDKLKVRFDSNSPNTEYNNAENTITLSLKQPASRQIEIFCHEGFHATHQALTALYLNGPVHSLEKFQKIRANLEIGAFIAELNVHEELTKYMAGAKPVTYEWINHEGRQQPSIDLSSLFRDKGIEGLRRFIIDDARIKTNNNGELGIATYGEQFGASHAKYLAGYSESMKILQNWFHVQPYLRAKIISNDY